MKSGSHSVSATWSPGPSSIESKTGLNQQPERATIGSFNGSVVLAIYRCGSWETGVKETSEAVKTARGRRFPVCWGPIWAQQPGRTTDESPDNLGTSGGTKDQELVADELAAAADEDGRSAGQACSLLLVAAGRGASEPAAGR